MNARNRTPHVFALIAAILVAATLVPAPAVAQSHRGAITLTGGGSLPGDLGPYPNVSAQFQAGWLTGLQLERWLGTGRLGLRLDGAWTQRELDQAGASMYNVFAAQTDLLFRLRRPRAENVFVPYVGLGLGATYYAGVASAGTLLGGLYGDPVIRGHVTPALGVDLFASRRSGIRFEVGDQIILPSIGQSPAADGTLPMVHNLVVTLGFQVRTGSLDHSRMAAETDPAPQAEPAPASDADRPSRDELAQRLAAKEREVARLQARVDSLERALQDGPTETVEPAPTAMAEPAPAPTPTDGEARFTVQVGSFVEAATADRWVARLHDRGFPVWRSDTVVQGEPVSRVRVGALATESEARTLADALDREYGWPVWVDQIRDSEPVPANAVQRTRDVLYR